MNIFEKSYLHIHIIWVCPVATSKYSCVYVTNCNIFVSGQAVSIYIPIHIVSIGSIRNVIKITSKYR
jgi:hypothetical protein